MLSEDDIVRFNDTLQSVLRVVSETLTKLCLPPSSVERIIKAIEYNSTGGKFIRGHAVVASAQGLLERPLTSSEFHELSTLGWLTEIWLGYLLVLDDIIDASTTRRKKACWYKRPDVGLAAMNDACIMNSVVFVLLRELFANHPCYTHFVDLFHESIFLTEIGQDCDISASRCLDPAEWTMETYDTIARYKTAFGIYYHPFVLSLYYLNMATPSNISLSKDILLPMGTLYQIQNDYLDIFGHAEKTGEEGTDIKENKCSWVIIQALNMCDEEERVYLRENYGKDNEETVRNIQKIFNSLSLTSAYEMEEDKRIQELRGMIAEVDEAEGLRRRVFDVFLDSLYRKHRF